MHHFSNGLETLNYLRGMGGQENSGDGREVILILDICIDEMTGVDVLEQIKGDTKLGKVPVVILSKVDDPGTVKRCHDLGCSTYVIKPEQDKAFEDAVRKIGLFLSLELASTE
jgi:CheY-like chemotaxis protein